ncbi:MAG TPA: PilZ domain-containing protein [Candidatus Hodarchaeales archaeon]|nr:PilZ domain-containing protein [Candidatus Hodarchaeales archaeon]
MKAKELNVENSSSVKGYVLRRSPRAMVRIPVVIKGVDKNGYEFEEETETFVVSKYGARIFTVHELEDESVLQLRLKSSDRWSEFRIVWIGKEVDNSLGHIGIEFIQTTDFFGVIFPGEDWT